MNIFVTVKHIFDPSIAVRVRQDGSGIESADLKTQINPLDEIALEAAIQLKERGLAQQVTAVAVGPIEWDESLRTALAMGADQAIRVEAPPTLEPLMVAHCLAILLTNEGADLLITGRQSMDEEHTQTGQMTSALLNWSQATFVSQILTIENQTAIVVREVEGGVEKWELKLPAVLTVDLRLNTPRYASLPNIMKAKRKPLKHITPEMLGLCLTPQTTLLSVVPSPMRPRGKRVDSVQQLLMELQSRDLL